MIGSNGAGKSTCLKSIIGLVKTEAEAIWFDGEPIGGDSDTSDRLERYRHDSGGPSTFPSLTIEENLLIGAYSKRRGQWNLDSIYQSFRLSGNGEHRQHRTFRGSAADGCYRQGADGKPQAPPLR